MVPASCLSVRPECRCDLVRFLTKVSRLATVLLTSHEEREEEEEED